MRKRRSRKEKEKNRIVHVASVDGTVDARSLSEFSLFLRLVFAPLPLPAPDRACWSPRRAGARGRRPVFECLSGLKEGGGFFFRASKWFHSSRPRCASFSRSTKRTIVSASGVTREDGRIEEKKHEARACFYPSSEEKTLNSEFRFRFYFR